MKKIQFLAVAILFVTSCSKENDMRPASSGTTQELTSAKVSIQRPLTINLSSAADVNSTNPPTACSGDLPGFAVGDLLLNGYATHLGQLIGAQSKLHHDNCDLSFTTALLTTGVSGQLAANNGDLVYFSGNDIINVFNLLTQSGPTGTISGDWQITGGTGRFTGASGSFTLTGTVDFATSTFTGTGIGTIVY